jgi:hypothetical protein
VARGTRAAPSGPARRIPGVVPAGLRPELRMLLTVATPATRAHLLRALQETAGNAAVQRLVATAGTPSTVVAAGGGTGASVTLHGETSANFNGGVSSWSPKSMRRAAGCTDCPPDNPCLHAVGTFSISYNAPVTITMPDMPDGLTACQQRRVRDFLTNVLTPHEREHKRRLQTYNGTTRHAIDFTGCGTESLNAHLQDIHDTEEQQRQSDAQSLSDAIDPFNRPIDLDCSN